MPQETSIYRSGTSSHELTWGDQSSGIRYLKIEKPAKAEHADAAGLAERVKTAYRGTVMRQEEAFEGGFDATFSFIDGASKRVGYHAQVTVEGRAVACFLSPGANEATAQTAKRACRSLAAYAGKPASATGTAAP